MRGSGARVRSTLVSIAPGRPLPSFLIIIRKGKLSETESDETRKSHGGAQDI